MQVYYKDKLDDVIHKFTTKTKNITYEIKDIICRSI